MYQKGTYIFETDEIKGDIGLKAKKVEESKNKLEQFQNLLKKGFKSPSDVRAAQSELDGDELTLQGAKAKLMVKENTNTNASPPSINRRSTSRAKGGAGKSHREGLGGQGGERVRVGQGDFHH